MLVEDPYRRKVIIVVAVTSEEVRHEEEMVDRVHCRGNVQMVCGQRPWIRRREIAGARFRGEIIDLDTR